MGFRDYYRQFEEMPPEEVSAELMAARDERRRRALSRIDALDLSGTEWHEPPHPDAVNAATFALRRAVNAYPDRSAVALREALAARHGVAVEQVAVGHGAGELLRGLLGGEVLVGWPGWQPLPELVACPSRPSRPRCSPASVPRPVRSCSPAPRTRPARSSPAAPCASSAPGSATA
jgi:hypothetical protein